MKPIPSSLWHKFLAAVFLAAAALGFFAAGASAQKPTPSDDEVNAVARQLFCPVCENVPLDVCPTQACAQWRDLIREKLAQGWSEEQIKEYFALQYGDRVLSTPPARGFNWLVYILPALFILVGVLIVAGIFIAILRAGKNRDQEPESASPEGGAVDEEYMKRIEQELTQRKNT